MSEVRVNFDVKVPCDNDELTRNVQHALSLGLPEADTEPLATLTVIANGPSAHQAPLDGPTLAINGAMDVFLNTGRTPTYWIASDPQPEVIDFLDYTPEDTTYFVASKCHPSVFERLKNNRVFLWHVADCMVPDTYRRIPSSISVTLNAFTLMRRLGWRRFETWGWDACYLNGEHHAGTGGNPLIGERGSFQVGSKTFDSHTTWATEAMDALAQISHADYEVKVHGEGMIAAVLALHQA